ncbi:MAG: glycerate kinase [Clostridia bacterium]
MRIIIAIDSFKGSLSAQRAADCIREGIISVYPEAEVLCYPLADGGEGLVDAVLAGCPGQKKQVRVQDPLGREITAFYGLLDSGTAVIEMAAASGLPLLSETERNPMQASSYGTGQLILAALEDGCRDILLGLGGSATNDGGVGMASALGVRFLDAQGRAVGSGGEALSRIADIDLSGKDKRLEQIPIRIACDVTNPLCGPEGASHIFGGQKGADRQMRKALDEGMESYAQAVCRSCGRDYRAYPGAGAAGGLSVPLLAFWNATVSSGIELVLDTLAIDQSLPDADLVITGEGRLDGQTLFGKAPIGVAARAKRYGKPVIALTGSVGDGYRAVYEGGIDAVFAIQNGPMSLSESMEKTPELLSDCAHRIMRFYRTVKTS